MDFQEMAKKDQVLMGMFKPLPFMPDGLYSHFCQLPMEELKAYPQKGYHWWMGRKARSGQALELRDYILCWRLFSEDFQKAHSYGYMDTLTDRELADFVRVHIDKRPLWVYEEAVKLAMDILSLRKE